MKLLCKGLSAALKMTGRRTFAEQGYWVLQVLFKTYFGPSTQQIEPG